MKMILLRSSVVCNWYGWDAAGVRNLVLPPSKHYREKLFAASPEAKISVGLITSCFQEIRQYRSFALDLYRAAQLATKLVADQLIGRVRYLNAVGQSGRFQPTCRIHRVAPNVIDESVLADDARYHLSRIN